MYIFGYGSLVNIKSAQKSFKRELKHKDFIPVVVKGMEKIWNSIEFIKFENEEKIYKGIFLNLSENLDTQTNGVLLKISDEEFEFLKLREKNYSCIKIDNKNIIGFDTKEDIFTFSTTKKEKIAIKGQDEYVIPKKYITLLEEGVINYDEKFQNEFKNSYSNFLFDIKDGTYIFADPIQNKYAKDGILK